ncbi:MAG: polysaccharide deacetylase family protein [Proteobacteria bacterium]|nr:polysaccharide deacetylase family protein [Pseudomonadota bacterium]MBU1712108.1 polysaccharide deacetylase family protein [Pseudomonadota bacterium]
MRNRSTSCGRYRLTIYYFMFMIALLMGCAGQQAEPPQVSSIEVSPKVSVTPVEESTHVPVYTSFVTVTVQEGDTLSSLAAKYLDDSSKEWLISDFNDITVIVPGQKLVIPLKYYERGGLTMKGYQIVPVLTYHKFSESRRDKNTVTASAFEDQMKLLKEKGYRVITLDQLFDFLDFKIQIPRKSVVITIDDGWRSAYDIAFPILKKHGYPATLFVYTGIITGSKRTLDWNLINEMANNDIDIQCHTKTHRRLTTPTEKESFKEYFEAIQKELIDAAEIIKIKTNKEVNYLAYPFGDTNHLVIALLKKQGYKGGFTVNRGGNAFYVNNYRVNRSMIYGDFDLNQFEKNLTVFIEEPLK